MNTKTTLLSAIQSAEFRNLSPRLTVQALAAGGIHFLTAGVSGPKDSSFPGVSKVAAAAVAAELLRITMSSGNQSL
jgi:hypothetical protein